VGGNGGVSAWDLKAIEREGEMGQGSLSEGGSPRPPWHYGAWVPGCSAWGWQELEAGCAHHSARCWVSWWGMPAPGAAGHGARQPRQPLPRVTIAGAAGMGGRSETFPGGEAAKPPGRSHPAPQPSLKREVESNYWGLKRGGKGKGGGKKS